MDNAKRSKRSKKADVNLSLPVSEFPVAGLATGGVGALVVLVANGFTPDAATHFALGIAMTVAATDYVPKGDDLLGGFFGSTSRGKAVFFSDDYSSNRRDFFAEKVRFYVHGVKSRTNPMCQKSIDKNLKLISIRDNPLNIMDDEQLRHVIAICRKAKLIVFDPLNKIHNLNENSSSDMAKVVERLEHIATETGAAVLFLHRDNPVFSVPTDRLCWLASIRKMERQEGYRLRDNNVGEVIGERYSSFSRLNIHRQTYSKKSEVRWLTYGSLFKGLSKFLIETRLVEVERVNTNQYGLSL